MKEPNLRFIFVVGEFLIHRISILDMKHCWDMIPLFSETFTYVLYSAVGWCPIFDPVLSSHMFSKYESITDWVMDG